MNQCSCDCFDHAIKGNFCKHIHFVLINNPQFCFAGTLRGPQEQVCEESENCTQHEEVASSDPLSQEDHLFFKMISRERRETDLEVEKDKIIAHFTNLVRSSCTDQDDLKSIWKFIKPIESTLKASKPVKEGAHLISVSKNKSKKNLTPQKRFMKKNKKLPSKNDKVVSNLDNEVFMDKSGIICI